MMENTSENSVEEIKNLKSLIKKLATKLSPKEATQFLEGLESCCGKLKRRIQGYSDELFSNSDEECSDTAKENDDPNDQGEPKSMLFEQSDSVDYTDYDCLKERLSTPPVDSDGSSDDGIGKLTHLSSVLQKRTQNEQNDERERSMSVKKDDKGLIDSIFNDGNSQDGGKSSESEHELDPCTQEEQEDPVHLFNQLAKEELLASLAFSQDFSMAQDEEGKESDDESVHDLLSPLKIAGSKTPSSNPSSDSEDDDVECLDETTVDALAKRRKLRPLLSDDELEECTQKAQKEEENRLDRLERKIETMTQLTQRMTQLFGEPEEPEEERLELDVNSSTDEFIVVPQSIAAKLKPHQREGVQFIYDCVYGAMDDIIRHRDRGSGCILAHCMGLGKTLQLIALISTVVQYPQLKTQRILVICPKSTILNWAEEFRRWTKDVPTKVHVYYFEENAKIDEKIKLLKRWHDSKEPGVLLIGYEAFRILVFYGARQRKSSPSHFSIDVVTKTIDRTLLNPGADLVICDEGHTIKNPKSATSRAVNSVITSRRVILTGTPMQNNLNELQCMVNFVKPAYLGTEREFNNRYANPIRAGQHKDSTRSEINLMRRRSFVLHKKLSSFVQRKEASVLKEYLPEKYEYVLHIPLTPPQQRLYEKFLELNPYSKAGGGGKNLLPDFTFLRKIWTHPKVLERAYELAKINQNKVAKKVAKKMVEEGEEPEEELLDARVEARGVLDVWWKEYVTTPDLNALKTSNKMLVLLKILELAWKKHEKVLIFSGYVTVLDIVEDFTKAYFRQNGIPWSDGFDYFRLDGSTPKAERQRLISSFNHAENKHTRCFFISARAGGQGINLTAANRVIILDTNWNPSSDQQNIFRIYRLGQKKPCFIYRLLAIGTMEEKIYSRSVTKQAMSFRVVDEQQIDRHFNNAELAELYSFTPVDYTKQGTPVLPKDDLLAEIISHMQKEVFNYIEHDSLLDNKEEEELSEREKIEAWEQYVAETRVQQQTQFRASQPNVTLNPSPAFPGSGITLGSPSVTPTNSFVRFSGPVPVPATAASPRIQWTPRPVAPLRMPIPVQRPIMNPPFSPVRPRQPSVFPQRITVPRAMLRPIAPPLRQFTRVVQSRPPVPQAQPTDVIVIPDDSQPMFDDPPVDFSHNLESNAVNSSPAKRQADEPSSATKKPRPSLSLNKFK